MMGETQNIGIVPPARAVRSRKKPRLCVYGSRKTTTLRGYPHPVDTPVDNREPNTRSHEQVFVRDRLDHHRTYVRMTDPHRNEKRIANT